MRLFFFLSTFFLALVLFDSAHNHSRAEGKCAPTYAVLDNILEVTSGSWELSFRLLVVGCEQDLRRNWPPKLDNLKRALALELQEPHPVQLLLLIRDRSPRLRQRLVNRINKVLEKPVVQDVFLFDAKAAESM